MSERLHETVRPEYGLRGLLLAIDEIHSSKCSLGYSARVVALAIADRLWALLVVLDEIHSWRCSLGKSARVVALAIAWHMWKTGESPGLASLMAETGLGRSAVMRAISEACGRRGLFDRKRRGPGRPTLYTPRSSTALYSPHSAADIGDLLRILRKIAPSDWSETAEDADV